MSGAVRLTSGRLAVFSPVALTPDAKAKVSELGGNVGYIIAGDMEHHIFVSEWAQAYPNARLVGPEGLAEKRAAQNDDRIGKEEFAYTFSAANKTDRIPVSAEFAADFETEYMDSHPNKEIVLFYKPDRVLIQADLMFNLPAVEQYSRVPEAQRRAPNLANRTFNSIQSTQGDPKGMRRLLWYAFSSKDRAGWNESVRRIDGWDFRTLVPCHGEVIEGDAKEVFRKVFEWHLADPK